MHNTFIYRHSDLPPVRPEIKAEIVGLDVQIADLILRSQGNYRELEELAEVLSDCSNSCELNLKSIRIIADNSPKHSAVSMTDLPMEQQIMIFSNALLNEMLLASLEKATGIDVNLLISALTEKAEAEMETISEERISKTLQSCLEKYHENPRRQVFKVAIPPSDI
jgi:hypothetical protein